MVMKPPFEIEFYKCNNCGKAFTQTGTRNPWLSGKSKWGPLFSWIFPGKPKCPHCGSEDVECESSGIVY